MPRLRAADVGHGGNDFRRDAQAAAALVSGAPIRSPAGDVIGALSISMPKDRFTAELQELLPERIKECAEQVTKAMKAAGQVPEKSPKKLGVDPTMRERQQPGGHAA